ncbi:hypothetical protein LXL04_013118 [Taraxacum kok-saghyz]
MARNHNHDDASSNKRMKTWSDLNHDLLNLVMMELGVIDYVAFSRVCKSWRSLALCNKNKFIMSRPPMSISIFTHANEKKCHLVDFEGRRFEIINTHSVAGRSCIGVTCGYLIWCTENTRDFWLVNPITRHELHFPFPLPDIDFQLLPLGLLGAILVFSHSLSGWVFVVFNRHRDKIWFCTVGKQEWTCVSTISPICHLQAFKGKIYTLYSDNRIGEVTLCPTTPKVTLLEFKNIPEPRFTYPRFASSGENLYVMDLSLRFPYRTIHEINLSKMKWVSRKKTGEENGFFFSRLYYGAAVIRAELWADLRSKYGRYARACDTEKVSVCAAYSHAVVMV